jgi:hypothetical protein
MILPGVRISKTSLTLQTLLKKPKIKAARKKGGDITYWLGDEF